jgi:hypothetical protein
MVSSVVAQPEAQEWVITNTMAGPGVMVAMARKPNPMSIFIKIYSSHFLVCRVKILFF